MSSQVIEDQLLKVCDLIDSGEIKLDISKRLTRDAKEQLKLAHGANMDFRKALTVLMCMSDGMRSSGSWRYWFDVADMDRFSSIKRLAEVEFGMSGNPLPELEDELDF